MARLYARGDWRLALAASLVGVLTGALVLLLWARSLGGGSSAPGPIPVAPGAAAGRGDEVGAFLRQVSERLAERPIERRAIRGSLSLRARDVVWRDPVDGGAFARVGTITGTIGAAAANRGDIVLAAVVLDEVRIELRSDGRVWNYERPMAGLLADEPRPAGQRIVTFSIGSLRVSRGIALVDMPERDFTLRSIEAQLGRLQFSGPGLAAPRLDVIAATTELEIEGQDRPWALAAEPGQLSFPNRATVFDFTAVSVAGTRLEDFSGVWDPAAPGYGVTATGRAPALRFADLQFLAPDLPAEGTASFGFALEPLAGNGTAVRLTDLTLVSGDSRASGSLAAEIFPEQVAIERVALRAENVALALLEPFTGPLPYAGNLTGTIEGPGSDIRVDILAALRTQDGTARFTTRLTGAAGLTRSGMALQDLRAELRSAPMAALRALAPGLPVAGLASGSITVSGSPRTTPMAVDARLELGTGLLTLAGTLDVTGSVPRYEVNGRVVGIDLQSVLAPAVPPVALTARFSLAGTSFDPAAAEATLRLDGSWSGWQAQPGDTLALSARVSAGTAHVDTLRARLATATLAGGGSWRFVEPLSGAVRYQLAVADMAPFGPYLPVVGDSAAAGSIRAEGTISGPLGALRLAGTFMGEGLRSGEWGARRLEAEYAVALAKGVPELEVRLSGEGIETETAGDYETLSGELRLAASRLDMDIEGERADGRGIAVVAEGVVPAEGARQITLQRAYFDLAEGRWELAVPANIGWGGDDGVRVTGLDLRNTETGGQVSLDGRVLPLGRLEARLVVADLPLDQVQDLLGREPVVAGRLWADLSVSPPGGSPTIAGTFRLEQAVVEGVGLSHVEGRIDYAGGAARTELTAVFDSAAGRLQLTGTLPLQIAFTDSVELGLSENGPLDATLRAERVALRPLALLLPRVRDLDGFIDGTLALQGTVDAPSLNGQLALGGGRVTVPELNQRFDSIAGVVAFNGRTAEFRDFRAFRGGWARVNGSARFEELDRPVLELAADLAGFQPIGVDEHPDAALTGRVTVGGELDGLVISGRVVIDDGYLMVPQMGTSYSPNYLDGIDPTPVLGEEFGRGAGGTWVTNARIENLRATFGAGAWVDAFQATLQLSGDLTIDKSGDDLRLTGTLSGERGTYTLTAGPIVRRFEITNAQIRFLGQAEPNPAIDITARRVILDPDGRRFEVDVRITGTAQTPRLALASADAPNIPESELLSFLLFGRQNFALGETAATTGGAVFEQTFFGGFAEFASLELERALASNLGLQLDLFQVRFGQGFGGLTTPTFVLGRQVANDFFLSVESGLNALFGDGGGAANTWAVRLEWAIDPRQTLELGIAPLNRARLLRGIGAALPPGRPSPQQIYGEYRRRWVY